MMDGIGIVCFFCERYNLEVSAMACIFVTGIYMVALDRKLCRFFNLKEESIL